MNISRQIEAILFWKAEPVSYKKLATLLECNIDIIHNGIKELDILLQNRGITIVKTDEEVMLGTASEVSSIIEKLTKDELSRDLGKAGLETLSIILYQGPISRTDIDYIRGVNSQFIVRNLLIRGLIERVDNPNDARSFLYKTTLDLLAYLGISKIDDLPEYDKVRSDINEFKQTSDINSVKQNDNTNSVQVDAISK